MAGLTSAGFEPKPLTDIQADLETGFRGVFGAAITVIAQSVFGTIIGIVSERLADLWQLGLAIYNASYRDGAVGIQLDNIGTLGGTPRLQATYTKVDLLISGTAATVIAIGRVVEIPGTGAKFTNDAAAVIGGGGTVTVEFRATTTGPVTAYAGTVTQINTPVSGWNTVTNPLDHRILGTNIETDAAYRLRQEIQIQAQGKSVTAAIRAAVLATTNVTDCFVFENEGDTADVNGLPPHSFETVAAGGTDLAVAQAILDQKPVGIATYGTTTQAAVDGNGFSKNVKFSRPVILPIYIKFTLTVDQRFFPANGLTLVREALANYGDLNYHVGSEVRASALVPSIFAATAGVLEVTLPLIGLAASPTLSTTIVVNNRQLADIDSGALRIEITPVYTIPS